MTAVVAGHRARARRDRAARPPAAAPASPSTCRSSKRCAPICSARWMRMCAPSTSCRPRWRSSTARRTSSSATPPTSASGASTPAFLASRPSDSEVLDRLRAARKLPEQADFRAWKADFLHGYRSVEQQETWWHLPDRRTLRVVINPNPQGGVTYLFDDVSERVRARLAGAFAHPRAERDPRHPEGRRRGVRLGRAPQAAQPRLRRHVEPARRR